MLKYRTYRGGGLLQVNLYRSMLAYSCRLLDLFGLGDAYQTWIEDFVDEDTGEVVSIERFRINSLEVGKMEWNLNVKFVMEKRGSSGYIEANGRRIEFCYTWDFNPINKQLEYKFKLDETMKGMELTAVAAKKFKGPDRTIRLLLEALSMDQNVIKLPLAIAARSTGGVE